MSAHGKDQLRSYHLKQIQTLDSEQKNQKSKQIQTHLKDLLQNQKGYWAGYHHLSDEPSVQWSEVSEQIDWCFPVVQKEKIQFRTSAKTYAKSNLGVQEPIDGVEVALTDLAGVIIPGLAFDQEGYRLGRGKGFYDRTLAGYQGQKIAVCYEVSLCEQLPHEDHDIQSQQIVTEKAIYQTGCFEGDSKWN